MSSELELLEQQLGAFTGPSLQTALWDPYFKSPLLFTIMMALFGCSVGSQGRLSPEGVMMSPGLLLRVIPSGCRDQGCALTTLVYGLSNADANLYVLG